MKLVVDIPDGMYDFLMEHTDRQFPYATEWIRQGTPYEERKTGEWIIENRHSGMAYCSKCGLTKDISNLTCYCEGCGTKMELR